VGRDAGARHARRPIAATVRQAVYAAESAIQDSFTGQPAVETSIRNTLGVSYHYLGEPALAIRQHERALALRTDLLGPDHSDTLSSPSNLANAYQEAGRLTEALSLLERLLDG
jgi:tetratricopeptide (TPR) repeat protein